MCILFFYSNENPKPGEYRLILVSNRDEIFKRPSKELENWQEDKNAFGGRDLEKDREGGTWLALSTKPCKETKLIRIGALLNLTGEQKLLQGRGRGEIVTDYIIGEKLAPEYMKEILARKNIYNGFNFVAIELTTDSIKTYHISNKSNDEIQLIDSSQCKGISNSLPDEPFKKVTAGEMRFKDIINAYPTVEDKDKLVEELLYLLKWDERHLPDPELKRRAPDWFDSMSSVFVSIPEASYGTRAHSIILIDDNYQIDYIEDSMQQPIQLDQPIWRLKKLKISKF